MGACRCAEQSRGNHVARRKAHRVLSPTLFLCLVLSAQLAKGYDIVREYAGASFFQGWDFYGSWDNLTLGNTTWVNQSDATQQGLAYVNTVGNAIIKVDNSSNVTFGQFRNAVRITTTDFYDFGSLWIIDIVHLPFGCSVWPAFWSKGPTWPDDGEIDIVEGINLMSVNQMALHTLPGCFHNTPPNQLGQSGNGANGAGGLDCSTPAGCTVMETKGNSFGSAFAQGGGGVWATQFDVAGVFMWFWNRSSIPPSIMQATSTSSMNLSDWGDPSASYPSDNCNMTQFFTPQQLVLDITLCGDWAGVPSIYSATCANMGPTGICYNDNVVGPGSPTYDNAYFEVRYLRAYSTGVATATPTIISPANSQASATSAPPVVVTSGAVPSHDFTNFVQKYLMTTIALAYCFL